MKKDLTDPKDILHALLTSKNPVCFIDSRIDFDAICSALALRYVLKNNYNKNLLLNFEGHINEDWTDKCSEFFTIEGINEGLDINKYDFSQHDLLICLDTGNLEHIALSYEFTPPLWIDIVNIDHHEQNPVYGTYNYVKKYGSACTVLTELFDKWNIKIDKTLANILTLGIITDTGFLQYNGTTYHDLHFIAELVKAGANYYPLIHTLTFNDNEKDMLLRKIAYDNMHISKKHRAIYTIITNADLEKNGITMDDSYVSPADLLKQLKGVDFSFAVHELPEPNVYKVSIRAHDESFDALKLAKTAGQGGGHHMAAGVHVKAENIEEAISKILTTSEQIRYQENS
jgi:bifunctional oligoribonuclease and PAP phosphatase NrnA